MAFTNFKIRTPMLECDIIESIMIICVGGASLRELEGYLDNKISNLSLKVYLFYLIDQSCISYGKLQKSKYFSEHKGFELMYRVYEECIIKDTSVDRMLIAFERIIVTNNPF